MANGNPEAVEAQRALKPSCGRFFITWPHTSSPSHHTTCCDIRLFSKLNSALKANVFQGLCSMPFVPSVWKALPSVFGKLLLILQGSSRISTSSPKAFPSSLRVGYLPLRGTVFLSYLIESLMLTSPSSQLMYLEIWLKWAPEVFATHLTSIYSTTGSSALTFLLDTTPSLVRACCFRPSFPDHLQPQKT